MGRRRALLYRLDGKRRRAVGVPATSGGQTPALGSRAITTITMEVSMVAQECSQSALAHLRHRNASPKLSRPLALPLTHPASCSWRRPRQSYLCRWKHPELVSPITEPASSAGDNSGDVGVLATSWAYDQFTPGMEGKMLVRQDDSCPNVAHPNSCSPGSKTYEFFEHEIYPAHIKLQTSIKDKRDNFFNRIFALNQVPPPTNGNGGQYINTVIAQTQAGATNDAARASSRTPTTPMNTPRTAACPSSPTLSATRSREEVHRATLVHRGSPRKASRMRVLQRGRRSPA